MKRFGLSCLFVLFLMMAWSGATRAAPADPLPPYVAPEVDVGVVQQSYAYSESPGGQTVRIDGKLSGPAIELNGRLLNSPNEWWSLGARFLDGDGQYDGFTFGGAPARTTTEERHEEAHAYIGYRHSDYMTLYTGVGYEKWDFTLKSTGQQSERTYYRVPFGVRLHGQSGPYDWTITSSADFIPAGRSFSPLGDPFMEAFSVDQDGIGFQVDSKIIISRGRYANIGINGEYNYRHIGRSQTQSIPVDRDDDGTVDGTVGLFEPEHERDYTSVGLYVRF